jgi:pimeloyl-ACP methyl ester carboxylesterase
MVERYLILAAVMASIGIAAGIGMIVILAFMLVRPKRMSDGRALIVLGRLSPADLGMEFESVSYQVIDESTGGKIKIAGWWISTPNARGRCAIILHGYADAKVGGIAWAPMLRSMGLNILALDLRAHGESGGGYCTAGYWERHDISQVIDQTKAQRPRDCEQIILFGVSIGGAIAAATAAMRSDLAAAILESPFSDFHNASMRHGNNLGTPGPWFQEPAYRLAQWITKADFNAVRPIDQIPKISCPVLLIQSGDDPFVGPEDQAQLRKAIESCNSKPNCSACWELPAVHHVVGLRLYPQEYTGQIREFVSKALQSTVQVCEK